MSLLYPRKIDCPESPTGFKIAPSDQRLLDEQAYRLEANKRRNAQRRDEQSAEARGRRWQKEDEHRRREDATRVETISADRSSQGRVPGHIVSMLRRHAAKLETFREQLMQMPRNLLEAGIVACAGQHGEIYASLANGGDRRVALRRAIKEIRTSDDPEQENVLACEYLERLLNADEVAERLLASKPRTIAAATVAPPAPARPADLWQRTTFNGIAYAGGVLNLQQGRTVLDLSTTRIKSNPLPVYQQHSGSRTVGNAQLRIDRTNNVIHLLNGVFLDTPASREILSGFNPETGESHPWQASVGTGQVGRWEQHKGSVRVNDRVFTDVLVARNSVVEECSFVGQGADIFRPNLVIEWKSK